MSKVFSTLGSYARSRFEIGQVYFGITNLLLQSESGSSLIQLSDFPVIEWNTTMQGLIGEAVLHKLLVSEVKYILVRIECSRSTFAAGGRAESEHWLSFVSELQDSELARQKCTIIFAFDRKSQCDDMLLEKIQSLRELLYPIRLAIECEHRTWHLPAAMKVLRSVKFNIVQKDIPPLSGFSFELQNFDPKLSILRILGRNQANWFINNPAEKYDYNYNRAELCELVAKVQSLKEFSDGVLIISAHRPHTGALSTLNNLAALYSNL